MAGDRRLSFIDDNFPEIWPLDHEGDRIREARKFAAAGIAAGAGIIKRNAIDELSEPDIAVLIARLLGIDLFGLTENIYGHFAEHLRRCIHDGFYRDGKIRMDIMEALKKIHVPVYSGRIKKNRNGKIKK
jgi:hypothetical protein